MKPTPQTGQIIKLANKDLYILLDNKLIREDGYEPMSSYNEELRHYLYSELDIVEIYELKDLYRLQDLFNPDNLECVWRRSEEVKYICITSCSVPTYWYVDKIGKVYKVKSSYSDTYFISKGRGINKADCTPVTLGIGSKVKVKKYRGQELYGIPVESYEALVGKELTIERVAHVKEGTVYRFEGVGYGFHESLVKPV